MGYDHPEQDIQDENDGKSGKGCQYNETADAVKDRLEDRQAGGILYSP